MMLVSSDSRKQIKNTVVVSTRDEFRHEPVTYLAQQRFATL